MANYYKKLNPQEYEFLNLNKYGKAIAIKVATLEETGTDDVKPFSVISKGGTGSYHGRNTALTIMSMVDVELHSVDSDLTVSAKYIRDNKIKIVFASLSSDISEGEKSIINQLKDEGVIFICSSGNDDNKSSNRVEGDYFISVGNVGLSKGRIYNISKEHSNVDFSTFGSISIPKVKNGNIDDLPNIVNGTSFSCPTMGGIVALIIEKARSEGYELNQDHIYKILKDNSQMYGLDRNKVGHGVISLPDEIDFSKYAAKQEVPGGDEEVEKDIEFKDVNKDKWSYDAIKFCHENGYMKGYEDGTFKPGNNVTREELAQVIFNLKKQ